MQILNLDALAKQEKVVTLGGVDYPVKEMSVDDFITANKEAKVLEENKDDTVQWVESTVRFITRAIPSMSSEMIRAMSLERMGIIVKFINGELVQELENAQGEGANAGK